MACRTNATQYPPATILHVFPPALIFYTNIKSQASVEATDLWTSWTMESDMNLAVSLWWLHHEQSETTDCEECWGPHRTEAGSYLVRFGGRKMVC